MNWAFDARIDGRYIHCSLTCDVAIDDPVFCFSLMAPGQVMSGGELVTQTGNYMEVRLPDLAANAPHDLVIAYANPKHVPTNRAWLPLGPVVRHAKGIGALPPLPAGVRDATLEIQPTFRGLRLVPAPVTWTAYGGEMKFASLAADHADIARADRLADRLGLPRLVTQDGTPCRVTKDDGLPPGGYALDIAPNAIDIAAADGDGAFHAAISLLVLRATHDGLLPCGKISDHPRFGWRGFHLDCARHFFAPEKIRRLLDLMALMKLNRFHWHFSDDEAFRLEIDCFPELWQRSAFRGQGELIPGLFGGGVRSGGSYTKTDVAGIVSHSASLGIEVMPEIEFPAHALALNRVIPGLRDPHDTGTEESEQGYRQNVVNPALPKTWEVVEAIASEVAGLFPFGHLHLGCDELPRGAWAGSPAVDRLKQTESLDTRDDVQGWAMERLAAHVENLGARPAAWEEAARGKNGGIGHGALLFCWTGTAPAAELAKAGYDVVMCPAQHVYLDMAHTPDPDDWGASWAAFVGLEDTIAWDPLPENSKLADRIVGVQGCFWAEFTTEDSQFEPMVAPRILGVAQMAWAPDHGMTGTEFRDLALAVAPVFDAIGWAWHSGA